VAGHCERCEYGLQPPQEGGLRRKRHLFNDLPDDPESCHMLKGKMPALSVVCQEYFRIED